MTRSMFSTFFSIVRTRPSSSACLNVDASIALWYSSPSRFTSLRRLLTISGDVGTLGRR